MYVSPLLSSFLVSSKMRTSSGRAAGRGTSGSAKASVEALKLFLSFLSWVSRARRPEEGRSGEVSSVP
ncbi:MAG: hypothetical protein LBB74_11140 [Chitinispirillales bacterium]|nr:hypothetical protein [Chitinispirillales bacterium]